jgi:UDP-3-O-[3-hydroxymyristoyl] glucosamine N-acyltransferase
MLCKPTDLVFVYESTFAPTEVAVIVTCQEVADVVKESSSAFIIVVDDVRLAQAKMKQHVDDYKAHDTEWAAIHSNAAVHNSVILGKGCRVGPNAVIGADCVFGENVTVRAGAVIEHGVVIGTGTIINANANIGYNSRIGQRVVVQAGAIIGSEGYGFAPDNQNHYHRIPHTGCVVLGDDVHVGANTCIDRGTYGETSIAAGVKIDNLVHIAHNVEVGEDTLLTAQTVIAGSSKIGKRVIASGQTGVLDHKTVADGAILVHRCGVTEDIPSAGMWAGSPAKPFKEFVRGLGLQKKVAKLELQIKELKRQLAS